MRYIIPAALFLIAATTFPAISAYSDDGPAALSPSPQPPAQIIDGVAAIVNDKPITFSEVRIKVGPAEKAMMEQSAKENWGGMKLIDKIRKLRTDTLETLIDEALIIEDFKAGGGSIPAKALDEHVSRVIRDSFNGDHLAFMRTLYAQGMTLDSYRETVERNSIVTEMKAKYVKEPEKRMSAGKDEPDIVILSRREKLQKDWCAGLRAKYFVYRF